MKWSLIVPNCHIPLVGSLKGNLSVGIQYAKFIENNGYDVFPLLFPWAWKETDQRLDRLRNIKPDDGDILLIPGGQDIDPIPFGYRNSACKWTNRIRDHVESSLMEIAMEKNIKIFGICRGFQLFFISQLGEISRWWQHINGHQQKSERNTETHFVSLKTPLLSKYSTYHEHGNPNSIPVNSMHHQAIELKGTTHNGYRVEIIGTAIDDDNKKSLEILEAARVYHNNRLVFAGVQWHPEELENQQDLIKVMLEI